ncbi:MAG: LacI family DNA-binding transcriptional regulator [Planctomycetes bacterium]|nr:LacI family DNA-binding transcriptional regulator [Planctomycetota bacterium]
MPITQKDLAKQFSVSQMTVSRALRGDQGVSKELRQSILSVAQEQGYTLESHHDARALRQRARGASRIHNVVCVMVWEEEGGDEQSFHGKIHKGIRQAGRDLGIETVMSGVVSELPLVVTRRQVDGVIRMIGDRDLENGPVGCPLPWVSLLYDMPGADLVTIDHVAASREVGRYLCSLGHRRIAFIGPDSLFARQRLEGIRAAARESDAEVPDAFVLLRNQAFGEEATTALLDEILSPVGDLAQLGRHFTALVAYNDYMAVSVMRYLTRKGLHIPGDLSIAGFDGALPIGFRGPQVTTAVIPLEVLGADALRILDWRLANPSAPRRRLVLDTQFMPGETSAPPRPLPVISQAHS